MPFLNIKFEDIEKAKSILGLGERATYEEIQNTYKTLAKKWHPDKCKDSDNQICNEKMKEINNAYEVLKSYIENYAYPLKKEISSDQKISDQWEKQYGGDPFAWA